MVNKLQSKLILPVRADEWEMLRKGSKTCCVCAGQREAMGEFCILAEWVDGKPSGNYMRAHVDAMRYTTLGSVTPEELRLTGLTTTHAKKIIDEYLDMRANAGEYTEAEKFLLSVPQISTCREEIALLVLLSAEESDIGWQSKVSIVQFSHPVALGKEEAEAAIKGRLESSSAALVEA